MIAVSFRLQSELKDSPNYITTSSQKKKKAMHMRRRLLLFQTQGSRQRLMQPHRTVGKVLQERS